MEYVIKKLINNNVVFSEDIHGNEIIIFGKAIGFGQKPGSIIPSDRIIKIFTTENKQDRTFLMNLVENIDPIYIDLAKKIVDMFEEKLNRRINQMMCVSLSDHIANAVQNAREGFTTPLDILPQIREVYPEEFMIAEKGIALIKNETGTELGQEEAGYIVLHYISSQGNRYQSNAKAYLMMQKKILDIIENVYHTSVDKTTFYYSRFMTHLNYFITRVRNNEYSNTGNNFVYDAISSQYPDLKACVEQIAEMTDKEYGIGISQEEKGYLALHINNLIRAKGGSIS
jgi:beta-glucoside operon transcriptional antiterminator